jgi:small subunit ribosomal protein S19
MEEQTKEQPQPQQSQQTEKMQGIQRRRKRREKELQIRRKKEFAYRGFTLEQLKKMTINELVPILPSRTRRSIKKGFTAEQQKFLERFNRTDATIRTHNRDLIILPQFVGRKIAIHNGKEFKEIEIQPEMIGHYLGEFAMTRKSVKHTGPGVGATKSSKFMPLK